MGGLDYGNDGYGNYGDPPVPDLPDHMTKNPNCGCSKKTKATKKPTTECIHTTGEISTPQLSPEPTSLTEVPSDPPTPVPTIKHTQLPTELPSKVPTVVTSKVPESTTACPDSEGDSSDSRLVYYFVLIIYNFIGKYIWITITNET